MVAGKRSGRTGRLLSSPGQEAAAEAMIEAPSIGAAAIKTRFHSVEGSSSSTRQRGAKKHSADMHDYQAASSSNLPGASGTVARESPSHWKTSVSGGVTQHSGQKKGKGPKRVQRDIESAQEAGRELGGEVWQEWRSLVLLTLLYMIQGIPLGFTVGAMPFMLQSKLSYSQMGIFSIASYPYSMKLLWSPIVDTLYWPAVGRRRSWILPIQMIVGCLMVGASKWVEELYAQADVVSLTTLFFIFVLLVATQDIAVDGWALTLLPPEHVGWASTCQTIGQSLGFFTSFTLFLALQDPLFCNKYLRGNSLLVRLGYTPWPPSEEGLVTISGYLRFWGFFYVLITLGIMLFKQEAKEVQAKPAGKRTSSTAKAFKLWLIELRDSYFVLWHIIKQPAVQRLSLFLLTYRLYTLAAESAYSLKLIEKGVSKEALSSLVLLQLPSDMLVAVIAGRWAAKHSPYWPLITGFWLRMISVSTLLAITASYPLASDESSDTSLLFAALAITVLASSALGTLCFTALGSFYNSISDPLIGGTYLTLLNTIANIGFLLPRTPAFYLMDYLTYTRCRSNDPSIAADEELSFASLYCPKKAAEAAGDNACTASGGVCEVVRDGYYVLAVTTLVFGLLGGVVYMRAMPRLMALPLEHWRPSGFRK